MIGSDRVFTKFTVGTDRSSPLRIAGAQLELDEERPAAESLLSISSASATNRSIVRLFLFINLFPSMQSSDTLSLHAGLNYATGSFDYVRIVDCLLLHR